MSWVENSNRRRAWLRMLIVVLCGLIVMGASFAVTAKMTSLSQQEMSSVSGREGILLDLNLQGSVDALELTDSDGAANVSGNAGFGRIRLGGGSGSPIVLDNGTGGQAALTGMSVDVDGGGSGNLVISLPQGDLTIDVPWASIVDAATSAGAGNSFGQFRAENVSVGNTTLFVSGKNEGVTMNIDLGINASRVTYTDPDGSSQNTSSGNLVLQNVDFGDFNDNSPPRLSGLDFDVTDQGLLTTFPSSSVFEAEVGDVLLGGGSFGRLRFDDMNWDGSSLLMKPNQDGIDGEFNLQYTADAVKLEDQDGWSGSGSTGSLFELTSLQVGATPWSGLGSEKIHFTLDADANRGLVFRTDNTDQTFDVRVGDLNIGGGDLGLIDLSDLNVGRNQFEIQPTNTGIEIDGELSLSVDFEVRYKDQDGNSGNSAGHISLGRTTNGVSLQAEFGGERISFTNLTLNVDPTNGLVVTPFSEEFTAQVTDIYVGNAGGPWNSFGGARIKEMDFAGSRFEISGKGEGVDVDGVIDFQAEEIRYTDGSGVSDPDFSGTSGTFKLCDNAVGCVTLDDGSGNPASFSNFQLDADGTDGLVVQAPSMSNYEFRAGDVNLSSEVMLEPVIVRDLDPSGSWVKVDAR